VTLWSHIMMVMEDAFKALSDANRRFLLDQLRVQDGQTLSELESRLDMSRFGVMKHLKILENASLVVTRKIGRNKYHYLNPVPIQEIAERWISAYAQPWLHSMSQLKNILERDSPAMTITAVKPKHVFTTIIQTAPEKLWEALTTPEMTQKYYFGLSIESKLEVGADFNYVSQEGGTMVSGKILEWDPPRRLVTTFSAHWFPEMSQEEPSIVTYEIEPIGECCKLTLIHDGFNAENLTFKEVGDGWPVNLSCLKTLLETGQPLKFKPVC